MREIIDEINRRYNDKPEYSRMKSGEVFPTDIVPAIAWADKIRQARLFTWGIPHWKGKGVIINARSETVLGKSMFSQDFARRRCIIPASGFFEWRQEPGSKKKEKYLFCGADAPVLYMAGLYNNQPGLPGFVILTTAASPSVQPVHNRMPVILEKHEQEEWLKDEGFARHILQRQGPHLSVRRLGS